MRLKNSVLLKFPGFLFQESDDKKNQPSAQPPLLDHSNKNISIPDLLQNKEETWTKFNPITWIPRPLPFVESIIDPPFLISLKCAINLSCIYENVRANTCLGIKLASIF